jgi:hypothetical protein
LRKEEQVEERQELSPDLIHSVCPRTLAEPCFPDKGEIEEAPVERSPARDELPRVKLAGKMPLSRMINGQSFEFRVSSFRNSKHHFPFETRNQKLDTRNSLPSLLLRCFYARSTLVLRS